MDFAEPILNLTTTIYRMVDNMKANKERCKRIADRVKALEGLVLAIKQKRQISDTVDRALRELYTILNSAKDLLTKFSQTKGLKSFLKSSNIEDKLNQVNQRLTENFLVLSGALQIEHSYVLDKVYQSVSGQRVEEEISSQMANTSLTAPPLPPVPGPYPTNPMLPPFQMPNPTAPMLPPVPMSSPTPPMLPPAPVSSPTPPMLPPVPVSSPTTPMPVTYVMPRMPTSTPFIAQPVYSTTTSRIVISNNLGPRPHISQVQAAGTANSMSVIRAVAPMGLPAQNASVVTRYVVNNSFLR